MRGILSDLEGMGESGPYDMTLARGVTMIYSSHLLAPTATNLEKYGKLDT